MTMVISKAMPKITHVALALFPIDSIGYNDLDDDVTFVFPVWLL